MTQNPIHGTITLRMPLLTAVMMLHLCFGMYYDAGLDAFATSPQFDILDKTDLTPPQQIQQRLDQHCGDCHRGTSFEGDFNLDQLTSGNTEEQLQTLAKMEEQLHLALMPPADSPRFLESARDEVMQWLHQKLDIHNASTLNGKLAQPEYGNYLDHQKLFSGEFTHLKGFTYDRRWLISEYIFDAKINELLNHRPFQTIDGTRQYVIGDNNRRAPITNPFLLPSRIGVRYYANETLNAGHLLTMMANAKEISVYMVELVKRDKRYLPAIDEFMRQQWEHQSTLSSRREFLTNHIERVLQEISGYDEGDWLPIFEPVNLSQPSAATADSVKKAAFHAANPGMQEMILIFHTMQHVQSSSRSDDELIEQCERRWFNFGDDARRIESRVTFLRQYLPEFQEQIETHRYAQKYKQRPYQPLPDPEMHVIVQTIKKHRRKGDHFNEIIDACILDWDKEFEQQRQQSDRISEGQITKLTEQLFVKLHHRVPTQDEAKSYTPLIQGYLDSMPRIDAIEQVIQTIILRSEFVYRQEFGRGESDQWGRTILDPRDASHAIAFALTDSAPDEELAAAASSGRLRTREDYRREVERILKNRNQYYVIDEAVQRLQLTASITNQPIRKLRFFREFFGYPSLLSIFKDNKRFGGHYDNSKGRLVGEADRLVEHILQSDENVLEKLLGSDAYYVYHSGDNEAMRTASERIKTIYDYFHPFNWQDFEKEDLLDHKDFLAEVKMRGVDVNNLSPGGRRNPIREFKTAMESFTLRFDKGQTAAAPYVSFPAHGPYNASTRTGLQLRSPEVAKFFNIHLDNWHYPSAQPAPVNNRRGMLSHPAWLIAHAKNTETDPISRGKWIREKLLAGTVPDLPVTVDAVIPEDHHRTLRQRLEAKTSETACWKCHQKMNPLGLPFEVFDDFGRFRTRESLEHPDNLISKGPDKAAPHVDLRDQYKTLPIDSSGYLEGTGDPNLDGPVEDALDLIDRLGQSDRVRQSIIRHAFRYFLGRNELLSDSKTLIDADRAYQDSGGSFDAVIVSLLTSDSFMFRKTLPSATGNTKSTQL